MSDIIQLLPDSVANQIAAGEVIQRPASAVKELMENAVDAGATDIRLIVKDAGKTLLQVIDNGCGMSATDARLSFERHATSKIKKAEDLFAIRTFGFRGEALASIAAIAHVEMRTRQHEEEVGTKITIEGSELKEQSSVSCPGGTSIAVKNLFYNVPARRNFLKSDPVELRHVIEEFQRVALAHSNIAFSLHSNNSEIFRLPKGTLRQRITGIFGSAYDNRLVPLNEETSIVQVSGFCGKPEFAKKTRGEQYFFLNKRFIRSPYLHHAVQMAYEELLPPDSFASYFIFLGADPKTIDVNIHPTKTEVKFEDEKSVYAILRSAVKQSLGKYNIAPSLNFDQEMSFEIPVKAKNEFVQMPEIKVDKSYNPFNTEKVPSSKEIRTKEYEKFLSKHADNTMELSIKKDEMIATLGTEGEKAERERVRIHYQLHGKYILTHIKSGFMIIDQQAAHERILYEKYLKAITNNSGHSQQQLFPVTIELPAADFGLMKEIAPEVRALGFDLAEFGKNTFVINGIPSDVTEQNSIGMLEQLIDQYRQNLSEVRLDKRENLARSMARNLAIRPGKPLSNEEMNALIDELFACAMPYSTASGKPTLTTVPLDELEKRFKK